MAEFALGLTKTAVAGTLGRVKSALEEEAELKERVQADMQFITSEFQIMQSFLNASNAGERAAKNQVVRTWVRQLRDLAFDVEDCVDFVLHLESPPWTNGLWRLVPSCCMAAAPPLPLDEAVAEIKRLKARVLDVSERNTRYNLISDSTATTGQQLLIMSPSTAAPNTSTTTSLLSSSAAAFHILSEVWEAAGKLRSTGTRLKELITGDGDNDLQVISLWGSPGAAHLEASHVIREAYNDPKICKKFRTRLWVKLTTSAFNPDEFLNSLLAQFYQLPAAGINICRAELLQRFNMKRYLLIIQGVSNVVEWDAIKMYLPNTNNGSRIVVSTEQLRTALLCTGNPYQVSELARFSDGQSVCAFSKGRARRRHERGAHDQATKFELIGRVDDIHRLSSISDNPGVISLWGVAGVGKSTLVRVMCHGKMDDHARERKSIKYSWVNVPHPFHMSEFSQRLLLDFHSNDLQAKETAAISIFEGQDTVHGCCKILRENKCLVVIDGLRSTSDWDLIKGAFLPDPIQRIHIIVITNEASIATHCANGGSSVFNVKGLDASSARELFTKIAWGGKQQLTTDNIEFSESIVAKCGGLPKVIAAIGKYAAEEIDKIRNKPYLGLTLETISRDIHDDFMGKLEKGSRFHTLKGLFSWMQSYFDACSDVLKPCIFYLSVYPAGYNIRPRRLLRRWVAEGYSRVTSADGTADDNGEMLFSELVQSSIIQLQQTPSSSGTMVLCQVNGFFHGYIISRPMEDNLVFALEGHCSFNSQRVGQHLTIRSCWDRDEIVFKSMNLSRLRSLTVFGEWRSFFISKDINMGLLRVLDLEDAVGVRDEDLEVIGKIFPRLKFLSLRGCEEITRLPDSLGGLRQLQTLDIRHTKVAMLPRAIIKLVKLQYVRAGCTYEPSDEIDDVGLTVAPEENCRSIILSGSDGTSTRSQRAGDKHRTSTALAPRGGRARRFVPCSWFSKKLRRHGSDDDNQGGVKVPAEGIGKLIALHTLGVVNVSDAAGKAIIKELNNLTQLRKLGVSGINKKNWHDLCSVISGHAHLESLSIRLDEHLEGAGVFSPSFGDISEPPETLKSLKLGGNIYVSPISIKKLRNLIKVHLELIISTQEDIDSLIELPNHDMFRHLHVKAIQDSELRYGRWEGYWRGEDFTKATVLKIDCGSYKLAIIFGNWIPQHVEVLVVQCSTTEASLEVSGLQKLGNLKEVWLKGSYSDTVKQHLQRKLAELRETNRVVLKVEE